METHHIIGVAIEQFFKSNKKKKRKRKEDEKMEYYVCRTMCGSHCHHLNAYIFLSFDGHNAVLRSTQWAHSHGQRLAEEMKWKIDVNDSAATEAASESQQRDKSWREGERESGKSWCCPNGQADMLCKYLFLFETRCSRLWFTSPLFFFSSCFNFFRSCSTRPATSGCDTNDRERNAPLLVHQSRYDSLMSPETRRPERYCQQHKLNWK